LTDALRRCGALGDDRVCRVAVESSRATLLSQIIRLRLSYEGGAVAAPGSVILKTGLPERADTKWNSGRQEVAFYAQIAGAMAEPSVPRYFEAVWDADTSAWHLLLEDLTDSHFTLGDWPMPPTLAQSELIIAARARFHAAWWDDRDSVSPSGLGSIPAIGTSKLSRQRSCALPIESATGCRPSAAISTSS
jgi:hypothetical protein